MTSRVVPPASLALRPGAATVLALAPTWQGTLGAGATKLRLPLHLVTVADGTLRASLDGPDQGAAGVPVDVVRLEGDALHLELTALGARYDGTLEASRTVIRGTWRQGGAVLP